MHFLLQSTAAYKAASRLAIATPPPAYVLSRGIGWQVCHFINNYYGIALGYAFALVCTVLRLKSCD